MASVCRAITLLVKRGGKPETDDIKTNHWNEPLNGLFVKVQWDLEQAAGMAGQEE